MQAATTERIFKLNAFMTDLIRQADDLATQDMIPLKMIDDAESMLVSGIENAFRVLFRAHEMILKAQSKKKAGGSK